MTSTADRHGYLAWLTGALSGSVGLWATARSCARDLVNVLHHGGSTPDLTSTDAWVARLFGGLLWVLCLVVGCGLLAALAGRIPGITGAVARRISVLLLPRALARIAAGACGFAVVLTPIVAEAAPASPTPSVAVTATPLPAAVPAWPTDPSPTAPTAPTPTSPPPIAGATTSASDVPATPAPDTPMPTVPTTSAPGGPGTGPSPVSPAAAGDSVTVRPGDSLWLISARRLGPDATPEEVAAQWPALYRANSAVIGADPDLIVPGQVLTLPS